MKKFTKFMISPKMLTIQTVKLRTMETEKSKTVSTKIQIMKSPKYRTILGLTGLKKNPKVRRVQKVRKMVLIKPTLQPMN